MDYPNAEEVKRAWREGPRDAQGMAREVGIEIERDGANVNINEDEDDRPVDPPDDLPEEPPESPFEEDPSDTKEHMASDAPDNDPDEGPHRRHNNDVNWFRKPLLILNYVNPHSSEQYDESDDEDLDVWEQDRDDQEMVNFFEEQAEITNRLNQIIENEDA